MIKIKASNQHWNYFLALEHDLELTSRYVEFCEPNLKVFSIEFAHLLLASASEVDVLAKCICKLIAPGAVCENINDYRKIMANEESLPRTSWAVPSWARVSNQASPIPSDPSKIISALKIHIPRHGLEFIPWENWAKGGNPDWWRCYNNVKHQRDKYFHEATMENAINSVGALLIMNYFYCGLNPTAKKPGPRSRSGGPDVTRRLEPQSTFMRLPETFYDSLKDHLRGVYQDIDAVSRNPHC